MAKISRKPLKRHRKDPVHTEIRKKLGTTQAQLSSIFGISRSHLAMVESKRRNLDSASNLLLTNMYLQFHELETGKQLSYRSLETRLFMNEEYRKILPKMQKLEKDCRYKIKEMKKQMAEMKERARDAGHAIIVFTTAIHKIEENEPTGKSGRQLKGLNLLKQQAYDNLLTCWEPEQAKLHGKIEAMAGEARSLRRYRIKVMREHGPLKK